MRSSIACARCRRSKVKCINSGINTTCRSCEVSGRECVYPTPTFGGSAKRDISTAVGHDHHEQRGDWAGGEGVKKPRPRKSLGMSVNNNRGINDNNSSHHHHNTHNKKDAIKAAAASVEVLLDSSILTLKAWEVVVDLFQSHFATLLPFLHPASFLDQIRQFASSSSYDNSSRTKPATEPSPLLLLGVLALTARHHPQLVAHCSSSSPPVNNPILASEFYARALRARLQLAAADPTADLTRVQAFLMLVLHEWSMDRGRNAWVYVGIAIRLSQAMGLAYELENDPREQQASSADDMIAQEVKRRTFWACFILDRCLSPGRYRPRTIHIKNLNIQLPSDNAFAFGERVRTSRLNEEASSGLGRRPPHRHHSWDDNNNNVQNMGGRDSDDDDIDRWEIGAEESVLSRVIRIIRIWGSIVKWSCAGGRR